MIIIVIITIVIILYHIILFYITSYHIILYVQYTVTCISLYINEYVSHLGIAISHNGHTNTPTQKKANYCDGIVIFRRGRADLLANDKFIQSTSLMISDCCSSCLQITPWIIFR